MVTINKHALNISAIILAAGKGSRIGRPKWQLMHGGETFLEIIAAKVALALPNAEIICVVSESSVPPSDDVSRIKIVINPNPDHGMFSSIYWGIKAAAKSAGYLLMPVDHPFVLTDTLRTLAENFFSNPDCVICPTYNEHRGHPIIIPGFLAEKIKEDDLPFSTITLRNFLHGHQAKFCYVNVNDKAVLCNVNTASDLNVNNP